MIHKVRDSEYIPKLERVYGTSSHNNKIIVVYRIISRYESYASQITQQLYQNNIIIKKTETILTYHAATYSVISRVPQWHVCATFTSS